MSEKRGPSGSGGASGGGGGGGGGSDDGGDDGDGRTSTVSQSPSLIFAPHGTRVGLCGDSRSQPAPVSRKLPA
jgi:hypothetical protein